MAGFGGAALYGAFPLAFSTILPALYIPIFIMVIALLFRGVAFEFRLKSQKKHLWEWCFFISSLITTIVQGLVLGTFVKGFAFSDPNSTLSISDWLNPFSIFCAISLIFGYVLLGSNRLIDKTVGSLQKKCFAISEKVQYIILVAAIIVSLWSPFLDPDIKARWFNPQLMPFLALLPLSTAILFFTHWYAIRNRLEHWPFWSSIGIFLMCYLGFIISSYPYLVPRKITYFDAAAPRSSLLFMLVGACIMLPPLLYYTYYSYRIFRGKVTQKIGY